MREYKKKLCPTCKKPMRLLGYGHFACGTDVFPFRNAYKQWATEIPPQILERIAIRYPGTTIVTADLTWEYDWKGDTWSAWGGGDEYVSVQLVSHPVLTYAVSYRGLYSAAGYLLRLVDGEAVDV